MEKRAVITGIGILSPLGTDPKEFFGSALQGKSAIRKIQKFDASAFSVKIGGELNLCVDVPAADDRGETIPTVARWAVLAARKAVGDAGLDLNSEDPFSIDIALGVCFSSLEGLAPQLLQRNGTGMASALPATPIFLNTANSAIQISRDLGIHGEVINLTTACSSSTNAIGYATRLIQHGESTCVLTGGAAEGVCPLFMGALGNGEYLSHRNGDPAHASRPFDRARDGGVLGDAACILVVEEYERARARNARIYCEMSGFGATHDAQQGKWEEAGARAIHKALIHSRRNTSEIDYYCAMGVSDRKFDIRETRMIKKAFGERARKLPISSIKSMIGNPLGAAGAVQTAACALAIRNKAVTPTINYEEHDPECDLDYVPNEARSISVRNALLYTIGNGGHNAALVLSAC